MANEQGWDMRLSDCCQEKANKARSASGWWFEGVLHYDWYECSFCHQRCDTILIPDNDEIFTNKDETS